MLNYFNTFTCIVSVRLLICLIFYLLSYLPSIIAMSFCRGLSTIHRRGAGRALRGAEVWRWSRHCFRTGPGCRDKVVLGFTWIWKHTGFAWPQKNTGAAAGAGLKWTEWVVLWQLVWEDPHWVLVWAGPACGRTCTFRVRCTNRAHVRLRKRVTLSKTIVLGGERS